MDELPGERVDGGERYLLTGEYDLSLHLHAIEPYLNSDWLICNDRPRHLRPNGWVYVRTGGERIVAKAKASYTETRQSRPERTGGDDAGDRGPGHVIVLDADSWEVVDYDLSGDESLHGMGYRYLRTLEGDLLQHYRTGSRPHATLGRTVAPSSSNDGYGLLLDTTPLPSKSSETTTPFPRVAMKRNYEAEARENRRTGEDGEGFVVRTEKQRLRILGRNDLADRVKWVSKTEGDGLGYDVLSFDPETGEERYIEVKSTKGAAFSPFFATPNELDLSREVPDQFLLYRVFGLGSNEGPRFLILKGDITDYAELTPSEFRAVLAAIQPPPPT